MKAPETQEPKRTMETSFLPKVLNRVLGPVAATEGEWVQAMRGASVVALLFFLALLDESAMTDPGAPLRVPGVVESLAALLIALGVAGVGFAIEVRTWQVRPARARSHGRFALYAGVAGVAIGSVVLAQNLLLMSVDPALRPRYAMFAGEPWWPPMLRAFSAGVTEEVLFRYIGMAAVAVIAFRRLRNANRAFRIAMLCTAIVFGALHFRFGPRSP